MYKLILMSAAIVMALSSCVVSSSKYDAMVYSRDSLQTKLTDAESTIASRNITIQDLEQQLKDTETDVHNLVRELDNMKKNYSQLKDKSSDRAGSLMEQIEKLQKELSIKEDQVRDIQSKLNAREKKMNDLRQTLSNALLGFTDKGLSVSIKNGKVYVSLSNQLLFRSGSTDIDKKGQEALLGLADVLKTQADINVLVEGHTDNQQVRTNPRFRDNWDLSVLRATEVVRYLTVDGGVDPTRVIASGRGEFFPLQEGEDAESMAANRRTEIILTPKLDELFEIIQK